MLFCRMLRWSLRCVLRRPPHTLLPYTTLFRSIGGHQTVEAVTVEQVAQDFPLLQLIIDDQDDTAGAVDIIQAAVFENRLQITFRGLLTFQFEMKTTTAAGASINMQSATHALQQLTDDGQTRAMAFKLGCVATAYKRLQQQLPLSWRDPQTFVVDDETHTHLAVRRSSACLDSKANRDMFRVFNGIAD